MTSRSERLVTERRAFAAWDAELESIEPRRQLPEPGTPEHQAYLDAWERAWTRTEYLPTRLKNIWERNPPEFFSVFWNPVTR